MLKLFNLGEMPGLDSVTVFHALARLGIESVVVTSPQDPIVSVGYFENLDESVDLNFCRERGISVMRREIGGGTTYLDRNQVFYQLILRKGNPIIPIRITDRYRLFSKPPLETYGRFGVEAAFRPISDLCTKEGRKIAGEAGGDIGECVVFAGGILLDFDYQTASGIIRCPDQTFRKMLYKSMKDNLTSMRQVLGKAPRKQEVESVLIEEYDRLLSPLQPARLTPVVRDAMTQLEEELTSPRSIAKKSVSPRMQVKIAEGVSIVQRLGMGAGGLIGITMEVKNNTLADIAIAADCASPLENKLHDLERALTGLKLERGALKRALDGFYMEHSIKSPQVTAEDLLDTMLG